MRGLGYQRYGAHGGDFGAAVTTFMALDDPAPPPGIHLSHLDLAPLTRPGAPPLAAPAPLRGSPRPTLDLAPFTGPGSRPLSAAEQAYLARYQRWREDDRG